MSEEQLTISVASIDALRVELDAALVELRRARARVHHLSKKMDAALFLFSAMAPKTETEDTP